MKEKAIIDTDFQDWTKGSTATIVTNFSNETITFSMENATVDPNATNDGKFNSALDPAYRGYIMCEKKASTVTKAQREKAELNGKLTQLILDGLAELDKPVKISELIKGYEPLNEYSTQKITPIITALVDNGKVERATVKREKLYSIKVVA